VKSVTLARNDLAEFPDAVTARGAKHLQELMDMVAEGHRAVMFYLVGRGDCSAMTIASDIDPTYSEMLTKAMAAGVEVIVYQCSLSSKAITIDKPLGFNIS
jgi:sugar fermentation stimulation protein A